VPRRRCAPSVGAPVSFVRWGHSSIVGVWNGLLCAIQSKRNSFLEAEIARLTSPLAGTLSLA